ncbi:TPA: DUF4145 domain-containing protein [Vibrio vulnificus]|nr:DUF4145 domain-containing protein [Vibrio vulnificus]HDY7608188.1 DUF4145 domain-containing protein [Vibrio vulnificus]
MFKKEFWSKLSELQPLGNYPALPCPYCNSLNLEPDVESFSARGLSGRAGKAYVEKFRDNDLLDLVKDEDNNFLKLAATFITIANEAGYSPYQFIAFFKCKMCNESVSATGFAKIPNDKTNRIRQIKVESFNPPVSLFPLNSTTPNSVNEELLSSFNHYFSDTCSAGNRLRRAIEKLCAELGFSQGNLHRRIQSMAKEFPQEARWLESLKLVGNEATHADRVSEDDLLDSYKVFEVVLDIFRRKQLDPEIDSTVLKLENKYKKI